MGFEGANVIFDTWVHPLVMGLEEHLLTMFREDFEFHDAAGASHHGGKASARPAASDADCGSLRRRILRQQRIDGRRGPADARRSSGWPMPNAS